jgi:ligand-binding sensor domain-containing protein
MLSLKIKAATFGLELMVGGVSKYDGRSFTHFTEKEGLGNNVIVSILEDKNKNLWFGSMGGGVCKYDGKTFTHFTEKEGLGSNFVNCIIEDKSGNLWIGTADGGVSKYDPDGRPTECGGYPNRPSILASDFYQVYKN